MTVQVTRRAAVLGHPIGHSLSPVLHRAAYEALGLREWRYTAHDVEEDGLGAFLDGLDESWAGLSLTMPLKRTVIPLLDHVEPLAEVVGAVNTVLLQGRGGGRLRIGANTDVHGIVHALREGLTDGSITDATSGDAASRVPPIERAAVLGGGATAASALAALAQLGCATPAVYVRSLPRIGPLMRAAHRMGVEPTYRTLDRVPDALADAQAVVSTLPPGAADASLGAVDRPGVLLDVAYGGPPSALVEQWRARGGVAVTGERMLLHQAGEQLRLMTGHAAPLAAMGAALAAALERPDGT